jgi:hypothetical protein
MSYNFVQCQGTSLLASPLRVTALQALCKTHAKLLVLGKGAPRVGRAPILQPLVGLKRAENPESPAELVNTNVTGIDVGVGDMLVASL